MAVTNVTFNKGFPYGYTLGAIESKRFKENNWLHCVCFYGDSMVSN